MNREKENERMTEPRENSICVYCASEIKEKIVCWRCHKKLVRLAIDNVIGRASSTIFDGLKKLVDTLQMERKKTDEEGKK